MTGSSGEDEGAQGAGRGAAGPFVAALLGLGEFACERLEPREDGSVSLQLRGGQGDWIEITASTAAAGRGHFGRCALSLRGQVSAARRAETAVAVERIGRAIDACLERAPAGCSIVRALAGPPREGSVVFGSEAVRAMLSPELGPGVRTTDGHRITVIEAEPNPRVMGDAPLRVSVQIGREGGGAPFAIVVEKRDERPAYARTAHLSMSHHGTGAGRASGAHTLCALIAFLLRLRDNPDVAMTFPGALAEVGLGATLDVDVFEWIPFAAGVKPALRHEVPYARVEELVQWLERRGFVAAVAEENRRTPDAVVYVARTLEGVRELASADAPIVQALPGSIPTPQLVRLQGRVGELLGYPACCVEAFTARVAREVHRRIGGGEAHEHFVAAEEAASRTSVFHGRLNDLLPQRAARLVSFFPCRYDCPAALAWADGVFAAIEAQAPRLARELGSALVGRMVIDVDGARGDAVSAAVEVLALEFDRF